MEKRCSKTIFRPSGKPYKPPKTAKDEAFRWLRDAEAAGSSPVTSTMIPNLTFRLGLEFSFLEIGLEPVKVRSVKNSLVDCF